MNHHSLLEVAFCGSVLSLLCGFAFTYKSEEDAIESHLFSRTFVLSGNPDSAIYVMKVDLNRDGREEYMVGDDQPALNDTAFSGDNEISFSLHIESRYQPGIGGGGIVSWYRNNPAVLVSRLESIEDPVLLAPQGRFVRLTLMPPGGRGAANHIVMSG